MKLTPVVKLDQINKGDAIVINDGSNLIQATVKIVKVTEYDGTEIIYDKKRNKFFSVDLYLDGKSWVKDVAVLST